MYVEKYGCHLPSQKNTNHEDSVQHVDIPPQGSPDFYYCAKPTQRFTAEFDDTTQYALSHLKKLNDKFTFPDKLDMSPWALREFKTEDGKVRRDPEAINSDRQIGAQAR